VIPDVARLLETGGLPALLAAAFAGGLVLAATPCVYPMIPVTVAAFAGQHASRRRAVALALLYVAGISVTYATLGVWAAATGRLFGSALADPRITGGFALLFLLLGAASLGWLPPVERWLARAPAWARRIGRASPGGAFAMGLVAGVLFAPCVGPFVVGVLAHVAATGDVRLGGALLGAVGLGMGAPFVALALVSGELVRSRRIAMLPRIARLVLGCALFAAGLYYASLSVSPHVFRAVATGVLAALAIDRLAEARRAQSLPAAGIALLFLAAAAPVALSDLGARWSGRDVLLPWRSDADAALADARAAGRFAVVDFTADWCLACHELDRLTLRHPDVARLLAGAERIRVDATRMSARVETLFARFRVVGLPAIVVVGPDGEVVEEARITSFVPPDEAVRRFRRAGLRPPEAIREAAAKHVAASGGEMNFDDPSGDARLTLVFDNVHEGVKTTEGGRQVVCVDFKSADGTVYDVGFYVDRAEASGELLVEDAVIHKASGKNVLPDARRAELDAR
jgi:thiol:disulfide interchange protein DsbD